MGDSASPGIGNLAFLGVVPGARQRGFGKQMLWYALEKATENGAAGLSLIVDARNQPAISLYQRFGFEKVDAKQLYLRSTADVAPDNNNSSGGAVRPRDCG
jgi:ribosomal protein S18 acetylase RimI-like enzyme